MVVTTICVAEETTLDQYYPGFGHSAEPSSDRDILVGVGNQKAHELCTPENVKSLKEKIIAIISSDSFGPLFLLLLCFFVIVEVFIVVIIDRCRHKIKKV